MATTTVPLVERMPADSIATRAHYAAVNELLTELNDSRRPDRAQGSYLMCFLSFLTKFQAPRQLLEYVRDLCGDGRPIGRPVLERVRVLAIRYAECRDVRLAIVKAELEAPLPELVQL